MDITLILAAISKKIHIPHNYEILLRSIAHNQTTGITPKFLCSDPTVKHVYSSEGSVKRVLKILSDQGILLNRDHRYYINTIFLPPPSTTPSAAPSVATPVEKTLVSTVNFPASDLMKKYLRTILLLRRFPHLHGIQNIKREVAFDYDHLPSSFVLISKERKKQMTIPNDFWGDTKIEASPSGTIMVHYSGSTPRGKRAMPPSVYLMWRDNIKSIIDMLFHVDFGGFAIQSIGIGTDVGVSQVFEIPKMDINTRFSEYHDTLWEIYESWDEEKQEFVLRTGTHYTVSPSSLGDPTLPTTESKLDAYMDSLFLLSSSDNALSRIKTIEDGMSDFKTKWSATQHLLKENQDLLGDLKTGAVKQAESIDTFKAELSDTTHSLGDLTDKTSAIVDSVETKITTASEYILEELSAQYTVLETELKDQNAKTTLIKSDLVGLTDGIIDLTAQVSDFIAASELSQDEQADRFSKFYAALIDVLNKMHTNGVKTEQFQSVVAVSLMDLQRQNTADRKNTEIMLQQNAEMLKILQQQQDRITKLEKPKRWFHFERKKQ